MNVLLILANEKHFPKNISLWEFDYDLFTDLPRIIVACDFSPSSFKLSKVVSYLFWQNTYLDLKTTCHIKINFFFVNKTLKELTPCKISHICRCDFNVLSESKENDHITAILICLDINLRFLLKNGNVLKK